MLLFYISLLLLLIGGLVCLFSPEKIKGIINFVFSTISFFIMMIPLFRVLVWNSILKDSFYINPVLGNVSIELDFLSAFFAFVISLVGFLAGLYSIDYMKVYINKNKKLSSHYFFQNLLIISMLLVVTLQNAIAFLIVWEIMSLSSFFLVIFEDEKKEVIKAGINYLISMHIGLIFIICGFLLLSIQSNDFDFDSFKKVIESNKLPVDVLFVLFFIGFGIKAGFFPLHTWLPMAHPAAPSPISGIMSGVMIKTGIYGILRILSWISLPSFFISYFVLLIALISGIMGVVYAIAQHDLKKLLAYHSVENIGIIGLGIGIGMLGLSYNNKNMAFFGFSGAVLHVLNHALFKTLLFFGAGAIYRETHTRNIEKLGGLIKAMPYTAILFLIGSIAISGLPPLNGFVSEFLIYFGTFKGLSANSPLHSVALILTIAGLSLIGVMALLCFTKVFSVVFLGTPRSDSALKVREVPKSMIIPMLLIGIIIMLIGFLPNFAFLLTNNIVINLSRNVTMGASIMTTLSSLSKIFFIFVAICLVMSIARILLLRKRKIDFQKTWDCGYQAGNSRMQYTASSFADSFIKLAGKLIIVRRNIHFPEGIFPKKAILESHPEDIIEKKVIKPSVNIIERFFNLFSWIQSGSTQNYLVYGLVFLFLALLFLMEARLLWKN